MGGLLVARVLSDYYEQVTIVDRDSFPTTPDHRKGVPQSYHAHALLAAGQSIIGRLFPGIMDDLRADGAHSEFNVVPVAFVTAAGKLPSLRQPGEFLAFSRYLLEWHVRDRLIQQHDIRIISNTAVVGLLSTSDSARVTGVQIRERGQEASSDTLSADLVVDASGRHSHIAQWLVELGYEAPAEESINSGLGYASRFYARPEAFPREWEGLIINGRPPHNPRAGLILPVDNGRWHVSLGGFAGHHPPTDEEGFLQWARDLPDPSLYEAVRIAQPLTPIRGYRTPENQLRHFERLQRWPAGLIVTGDAVCAFNPIYGQGMTVSALDAMTLNRCLQEQQRAPQANFEQHFQQELAKTVANAWLVATSEDLRWPGVALRGARPAPTLELLHRYMDLVLYSAVEDPQITLAYLNVITMINPPRSLASPRMITRVFGSALKRSFKRIFGREHEITLALSREAIQRLQALPEVRYEQAS
jgi:2-polyprenyl-6-methoxyphenol hydroxylase-like FAD-dependent oxidoreductase